MEFDSRLKNGLLVGITVLGVNTALVLSGIGDGDTRTEPPPNLPYTISLPRSEFQRDPERERTNTLQSKLGFHDTPFPGGSIYSGPVTKRVIEMGGRSLIALNPRDEILDQAAEKGIAVIARYYSRDNRVNEKELGNLITRMKKYQETSPIIVPFNEVNLLHEIGGTYRSPEEHIEKDFLPAYKLISSKGGITLLTPLAQNAVAYEDGREVDEFEYLQRMLLTLRKYLTDDELQSVALGVHAYAMTPGKDIGPRLTEVNKITRENLGIDLPMYITEGGLHQTSETNYPPQLVAAETKRLLQTPVETISNIKIYGLWVIANNGQRKNDEKNPDAMKAFDAAAIVDPTGELTETGLTLKQLAQEQAQIQIFP